MFGKQKIDMDVIVPTSKMALKASCMRACGNDVDKATKLYDFFVKDMATLPDFDITPPSTLAQIKDFIGNAFNWVDQNQEKLVGYYQLFQQMRGGQSNAPATPPVDVPPIPES